MQRFEIHGETIVWPEPCACCLAPSTHTVSSTRQKSTFVGVGTVRRSVTVRVPYCEECHRHVLWSMGPGIIGVAFVSVLLFIGAAIVGLMLGGLLVAMLSRPFPVAFNSLDSRGSLAVLIACTLAAGVSAAVIYARSHLRNHSRRPLGPEHFSTAPAAAIVDFSKQGITLEVYNPKYAALMSRANPPLGSS